VLWADSVITKRQTVTDAAPARKWHRCEECGLAIPKGINYLRQSNTDGADIWHYKAHTDCNNLGLAVRTKFWLWGDRMPLHEVAQDEGYTEQFRGLFPYAVCRIEFTNR
jgi:hypothetical protein